MSRRTLVVTDQVRGNWIDRARAEESTAYIVMPVGFGFERFLSMHRTDLGQLQIAPAPLEQYSAAAENDLREFYPRFVFEFPRNQKLAGTTILELLRQDDDVNLWWLGETCEKGPLRGPLQSQLYTLALLRHLLDQEKFDHIWIEIADDDLRATLLANLEKRGIRAHDVQTGPGETRWLPHGGRFWIVRQLVWRALTVLQAAGNRLVLQWEGMRRKRGGERAAAFFTRYPALWTRAYATEHRERYFPHLEQLLGTSLNTMYVAAISDWPWKLLRHRRRLATIFAEKRIEPLPLYTSWSEMIRVLVGHGLLRRLIRYRRMSKNLTAEFAGWDISRLWDAELRRTLSGPDIPGNLLLRYALRRFSERNRPLFFMNPLEYQPMERALWSSVSETSRTVALQHSTYGRNHLMYYFKPGELRGYFGERMAEASPMPEFFLAAGPRPRAAMLENGIPVDRIGVCGAVRYDDLRLEEPDENAQRELRQGLGITTGRKIILVATPIGAAEAIEMIGTFTRATPGFKDQVMVIFKYHYHTPIESEIRASCAANAPRLEYTIADVDGPLYQYIRAADLVMAGGSTVAVEALALGKVVLAYRNPALLNLNPLADFPGSAIFVSSPDAIASAVNAYLGGQISFEDFRAARLTTIMGLFDRLDGQGAERAARLLRERGYLAAPGGIED